MRQVRLADGGTSRLLTCQPSDEFLLPSGVIWETFRLGLSSQGTASNVAYLRVANRPGTR